MTRPTPADTDLSEILRQCLAGLALPLPALGAWLDRIELRK